MRTYSTRPPPPLAWSSYSPGNQKLLLSTQGRGRTYEVAERALEAAYLKRDEEAEAEAKRAYLNTRRSLLDAEYSPGSPTRCAHRPRLRPLSSSSSSSHGSDARAARAVRLLPERAFALDSPGKPKASEQLGLLAASATARAGGGMRFVPLSELQARAMRREESVRPCSRPRSGLKLDTLGDWDSW